MKTYLAAYPSDRAETQGTAFLTAHIAYKISSMRLMRGRLSTNARTGLMVISDIDTSPAEGSFKALAAEVYNECLRRSFDGVIPDFSAKPTADTSSFAAHLCDELCRTSLKVYVPYLYSVFCPDASYIISSAISGGSLREHWQQLIEIHGIERLAVEIERIAMDFIMPSATAEGKKLTQAELSAIFENTRAQSFYSAELCTNYFTYSDPLGQTHFVLFDNARSMADKIRLAEALGFKTAFLLYPEIKEILPEISTYICG